MYLQSGESHHTALAHHVAILPPERDRSHSETPTSDQQLQVQTIDERAGPLSLPAEVLSLIWGFCDRETLKAARYMWSSWAHQIGPMLFDRITLIPHIYFMQQFLSVFDHSHLRHCIIKLYIDARWIDEMTTLFPLVPLPKISMHDLRYPNDRNMILDQLISVELPMLMSICDLLPSLSKVAINFRTAPSDRNYIDQDCLPPPIFVAALKRLGKQYENAPPPFQCEKPMSLLGTPMISALSSNVPHLRALVLESFNPEEICRPDESQVNMRNGTWWEIEAADPASPFTQLRQTVGRIQCLDLQLRDQILYREEGIYGITAKLLQVGANLVSLNLRCHEITACNCFYSWYFGPHQSILGHLMSPEFPSNYTSPLGTSKELPCFPQLQRLWLADLSCSPQDLQDFSRLQCPQLNFLSIKRCHLVSYEEFADEKPCWIRTLKKIRLHLHLTEMDFGGFLTNQGGQHWHIAEDEETRSDDSVKQRVIKWFLERQRPDYDCPLNVFEIYRLETEDARRAATDDSWSMVCPQRL